MSVEYIDAVYQLRGLTAAEVSILAYLANRANEQGRCWPTRATIGGAVSLHPDTVKTTLAGLAAADRAGGPLIGKENRTEGGRVTSSMIALLFEPGRNAPDRRGRNAPTDGGNLPPANRGRDAPEGRGSSTPGKETSEEASKETPRKVPKGTVSPEAKALADAIWSETPKIGRQRSGLDDLGRACNRALADGAEPALVRLSLRTYYADPDVARDDGAFAKGVHRMVQQDRWREWIPEDYDLDAPAPAAPEAVPPEVMAAHMTRVWTSRLEDFQRIQKWDRPNYGPRPGETGCAVPAHVLASFGFA